MPKLTPAQAAAKWATRTRAATQDYAQGVQRVTESPTEAAADAQDKLMVNFLEAVNSGRWAASLRNVSLEAWKQAASTVGAQRLGQGVDKGTPKMQAHCQEVFPYMERLQDELDRMPNVTYEDSVQRAIAWMNGMHAYKTGSGTTRRR